MALSNDLRYALRTFRKNPGLVAAIVVSIGFGIAANTAVFSFVNAFLFGQLAVREPGRVLSFDAAMTYSWPDYLDYREALRPQFEDLSAHVLLVPAGIGGNRAPERIWGQLTTGNYWKVIGAPLQIGRPYNVQEHHESASVVVLSDSLWRRRFNADRQVIGQKVLLNGAPFTVLGVATPAFAGTERGLNVDFWAPLGAARQVASDMKIAEMKTQRFAQWVVLHGRLRPGVSQQQAQAAVNAVKQRLDQTYRKNERFRPPIKLTPAGSFPGSTHLPVAAIVSILMTVVGLVLLIACANVANLLLARAASRQKEIGVRLAVGASRGRLIRQLLVESILLSSVGAFIGFGLAYTATTALSRLRLPIPVPLALDFTPDLRVFAFTASLAIVTGVVFGLLPALRATRPDLLSIMKQETATFGSFRRFGMRNSLVIVQVSLSLVLLIGAVLFVRSLQHASSIQLGMNTDRVMLLAFDPKLNTYSNERTKRFLSDLRERVSANPEVESVSYLDTVPLSIGGTSFGVQAVGVKNSAVESVDIYNVGARYFETLGIPLVRGRDFRGSGEEPMSIIVNEAAAQKLFGNQDPLEGQIRSDLGSNASKTYHVVGIARNSKSRTIGEQTAPIAYLPLEADPAQASSLVGISIAVKTRGAARQIEPAVRADIAHFDPMLPVFSIETMQEHVDKSMLLPRILALLLGVFGGAGLILALVGLYGVLSYSVRSRFREIGIRMALGASRGGVVRMVLAQGLTLAILGIAIGTVLAVVATRFIATLLYGISPTDAVTFAMVLGLMGAVALLAILPAARRAAGIEPLNALRYE